MRPAVRSAILATCFALGLTPAFHAAAELSQADADRYLTAMNDIARLKGEATQAYTDAQTRFNAKDTAGACADLKASADKFGLMADASGVIISLSADKPAVAALHKSDQDSEIAARNKVLATMASICPADTGMADAQSDAIHTQYDADMADYEALSKSADDHFDQAKAAADNATSCSHYKAGLDDMKNGDAKLDEMIVLIKQANADPSEMETTRSNNQAIVDQTQTSYNSTCPAT